MSENTYYIMGGIAIVSAIYLIFAITFVRKRKKKQLEKFANIKPLNRNEKHALVFGAILFYHRGEDILEIKPKDSIDTYKNGLRDSWEITNKEEAFETINNLISLERSKEFDPYLEQPSSDLITIQKKIAKGLKLELEEVQKTKSTFAWDTCRSVSLTKWCFWCGYLSEQECWELINKAVKVAQSLGSNWKNYTISFLLGRTMQGFDLDDVIIESEQLLSGKTLFGKKEYLSVYSNFPFN
ncbi:DUF1266 domain-containing protein [Aureibaculum marinum]|uniref:DUF1266 domain-containing protein n=1 Tax=Aureibaculum marinum TaxID=2487930 RepID=A0A3N4N6A6_9FLAO|nr:DUF1266 domain-containing protein [Aureibaculum marinum]RPD90708.1 DUF1266 domain-containing protein [Aureibaculum marinum]